MSTYVCGLDSIPNSCIGQTTMKLWWQWCYPPQPWFRYPWKVLQSKVAMYQLIQVARAMLSTKTSRISTNCPDWISWANSYIGHAPKAKPKPAWMELCISKPPGGTENKAGSLPLLTAEVQHTWHQREELEELDSSGTECNVGGNGRLLRPLSTQCICLPHKRNLSLDLWHLIAVETY